MKKRRQMPAPPMPAPPAGGALVRAIRMREHDLLVALAALLCIALGYLTRLTLNPDGVSYLDLAAAMQRGDWSRFVQGYWSPMFPFLIGGVGWITGLAGAQLVPVTHAINTVAALGALFLLRHWGRRTAADGDRTFQRATIATFLVVSWGLPKVEAVTPDTLLFAVAIWLSYELLAHGGRRWWITGLLLGAAFLIKTSAWPWLLLAVPLRLLGAADAPARRRVGWSTLVCFALTLVWIVPISLKAGRPTLGSAGRLNYSWYIKATTSRLPDTDTGHNTAYEEIPIATQQRITVATFDDAAHWTYQPWGDPTAWRAKVLTDTGTTPTALQLLSYWLRDAGLVFGLWLMPVLIGVMAPVMVLRYRRGMWRTLVTTQRDALVVLLLGFAGLLQFVAVHAEPRLLAPFGIMLALGWIHWCCAARPDRERARSEALRETLRWTGVAVAIVFAILKLMSNVDVNNRLEKTAAQVATLKEQLELAGQSTSEIAIVGPAAPVVSAAYWMGTHIVMQIPPRSVDVLASLPQEQARDILLAVFSGKVSVVWQTTSDGGMKMLIVPPRR